MNPLKKHIFEVKTVLESLDPLQSISECCQAADPVGFARDAFIRVAGCVSMRQKGKSKVELKGICVTHQNVRIDEGNSFINFFSIFDPPGGVYVRY